MSTHEGGFIQEAGKKVKEIGETAKEKVCHAGHAIKESAHSAYEKVHHAGCNSCDAAGKKLEEGKNEASQKTDEAKGYVADKMHQGADAMKGK
ncbi:hypothetical protein ANCCAN_16394 [Ancylostoma caninum]|uniref:Late embryogeneis abundant protein n=1 Tax=Ancylostoma caninum TaxID=29170 RepID=A0A368G007_ANCCA|nr:hypothetical protein ANCCAN_16394 [Ancylostoma caninum]